MEPSAILALLVALAFAGLIGLAAVRMSKKKPGRELPEEFDDEAPAPRPAPRPEPPSQAPGRAGEAPRPVQPPRPGQPQRPGQVQPPRKVQPPRPGQAIRPVGPARPGQPGRPGVPPAKAPGKAPAEAPLRDLRKVAPVPEPAPEPARLVFPLPTAKPLGAGLERTRKEGFVARLVSAFQRGVVDDALIAQAEEALLTADVGVRTATEFVDALKNEFKPGTGDLAPQVLEFFRKKTLEILEPLPHGAPKARTADGSPAVIMVVGVNGTGKTTTIGKMANFYKKQGRSMLLCAGDTYRAAGMDQLAIWGTRVDVPVVVGSAGQDPASLMFDTARRAVSEGADLVIADTAGRLHTNVNLVDELKKVHKVLGKAIPGAPHEVLLVLDATMGQNAVRQADIFRQAVNVTGIVLAKLDGTAKGGVVLSIARDMGLPIRFVGVGEAVDDLRPFDPREFADALFSL